MGQPQPIVLGVAIGEWPYRLNHTPNLGFATITTNEFRLGGWVLNGFWMGVCGDENWQTINLGYESCGRRLT